jgi:hypothetical protein
MIWYTGAGCAEFFDGDGLRIIRGRWLGSPVEDGGFRGQPQFFQQ